MSLNIAAKVGEYRILSRIGRGAYGEVFAAEHVITRRRDALKVLVDGHLPEEADRFLREIQVQASLHHPNIAEVYNALSTPHGPVMVMELVQGEPLSAILNRERLPLDRGTGYVLEMLEGLAYAHERGVVHRDIKPENIMVVPDGSVKLTDFGLAKTEASPRLTQSGSFAGSPCYMAPEQGVAGVSDTRSDTYSAGVVLYEVVTGRLPFTGETAYAVMTEHQNSPPSPPMELNPAIGAGLNAVILKALEKQPEKRFQTAAEFRAALEIGLLEAPGTAKSGGPASVWRTRMLVVCAVSTVMAAASVYPVMRQRNMMRLTVGTPAPVQPVQAAPAVITVPPSEPVAAAPVPDLAPGVQTPLRPTERPRKPLAPPVRGLRITGSIPDVPEPSHAAVRKTEPAESPAPATAAVPAAPQTQLQTLAPAMPATLPDPETAPPKRRNVVVRTFQKVFQKHPKSDKP
ncbi:MAG TPA: protein kinase [Bryobacteraceae bacterium]|nr:protein kinase [Bryobacteraceae bacterium]